MAVSILFLVIGALDLVTGIVTLCTGKLHLVSDANQYTEASRKVFAPYVGCSNLITGVTLILYVGLEGLVFKIVDVSDAVSIIELVVGLLIGLTVYLIGHKKLVKKAA